MRSRVIRALSRSALATSRLACACATSSGREPFTTSSSRACRLASWPCGLLELRLVLVVFQAHEHLAFADAIAFIDADPLHLADHLGGHLDLVRGHDVAGGVEDHALRARWRR